MDFRSDQRQHFTGINGCAECEDRTRQRIVGIWPINFRARLDVQAHVPHVSDHTDNRHPGTLCEISAEVHPLADRILIQPEFSSSGLIDKGDLSRILTRELASTLERNAHGFKVIGARDTVIDLRAVSGGDSLALQREKTGYVVGTCSGTQRKSTDGADGDDAGDSLELFFESVVQREALLRLRILRRRHQRIDHDQIRRPVTRIDIDQMHETPNQQTRCDKKNKRQRHFRNRQHVAHSASRRRRRRRPQIHLPYVQCRHESKQDAGNDG